jgi:hypothetical protein
MKKILATARQVWAYQEYSAKMRVFDAIFALVLLSTLLWGLL